KEEIQLIGVSVFEALENCLKALNDRRIEDLSNVEFSEKKILLKSNEIDIIIVGTLALYSPEAKDLRRLVSFLKITN
ncbi:PhoU domain-containing protein, partial [Aliarcobacter butzleri]|uniref:PhoU domain-containing protein n=1 Tax=Aliarcobacter butzleri TaxID=28197 RepID=UPI003ADD9C1A